MSQPNVYTKTYRWNGAVKTVMSAKAATGIGTNIDVSQWRHVQVVIIGASSPSLTVKACGSFLADDDANLDFSAAASATNPHDFVGMYDLQDGSFVAGDTGIAFTGSGDVRQFQLNTDGLRTVNFNVTARAAGTVTVLIYGSNNQ